MEDATCQTDRMWLVEQNETDLEDYYSGPVAELLRDIIERFRRLDWISGGLYGSGNNCYRAIRERPGALKETLCQRAYAPTAGGRRIRRVPQPGRVDRVARPPARIELEFRKATLEAPRTRLKSGLGRLSEDETVGLYDAAKGSDRITTLKALLSDWDAGARRARGFGELKEAARAVAREAREARVEDSSEREIHTKNTDWVQ
ncbi:hypothetical protein PG984_004087 [Apiospora sp. TS-2023a]